MGGTRGTGCKPRERNQFPSTARPARRREARAVLRRHCVHFLGGERAARIDYPHGICESGPRTQLVCILNFSTGKIGRKSAENATLRTLQIYKCSKCTRCSLARAPDRRAALSPVFCFFLLVSSCTHGVADVDSSPDLDSGGLVCCSPSGGGAPSLLLEAARALESSGARRSQRHSAAAALGARTGRGWTRFHFFGRRRQGQQAPTHSVSVSVSVSDGVARRTTVWYVCARSPAREISCRR